MDKFLEVHNLLRLNLEEIQILNKVITSNEIELGKKTLPINKNSGPDSFTGKFY